jgi:hypothetical protein
MLREKNLFDKIGSLIPGYVGYIERERRRQCDKILRDHIAAELLKCENIIQSRIAIEIEEKNYEIVEQFESARKKIDTLLSKIKYSPSGGSAFFSVNQIRKPELENIFQKDLLLGQTIKQLEDLIQKSNIQQILSSIDNLYSLIYERNEFIKEYK